MITFFSALHLPSHEKQFLEKLFKTHSKRMWLICVDILKNKQDAEDAVHDAFIKLMENVSRIMSFESEDQRAGYVYVVTKNMALYYLRKRKRQTHLLMDEIDARLEDKLENIEQLVITQDELELVKMKMNQIKASYKEIVYLRYFLNLDYEEIANILHITINHARVRVHLGLKKIIELLDK